MSVPPNAPSSPIEISSESDPILITSSPSHLDLGSSSPAPKASHAISRSQSRQNSGVANHQTSLLPASTLGSHLAAPALSSHLGSPAHGSHFAFSIPGPHLSSPGLGSRTSNLHSVYPSQSAIPSIDIDILEIQRLCGTLQTENATLRAENATLRANNAAVHTENVELRGKFDGLR